MAKLRRVRESGLDRRDWGKVSSGEATAKVPRKEDWVASAPFHRPAASCLWETLASEAKKFESDECEIELPFQSNRFVNTKLYNCFQKCPNKGISNYKWQNFTYQKLLCGFLSNSVANITKICSTYLKKGKRHTHYSQLAFCLRKWWKLTSRSLEGDHSSRQAAKNPIPNPSAHTAPPRCLWRTETADLQHRTQFQDFLAPNWSQHIMHLVSDRARKTLHALCMVNDSSLLADTPWGQVRGTWPLMQQVGGEAVQEGAARPSKGRTWQLSDKRLKGKGAGLESGATEKISGFWSKSPQRMTDLGVWVMAPNHSQQGPLTRPRAWEQQVNSHTISSPGPTQSLIAVKTGNTVQRFS